MKKLLLHLFVAAWLSMLLVAFGAIPSESAEVSRPTTGPVKVYVTIFIIDVDEINSASQNFDANVYIQYRWRDQRLAHKGSKSIVRPLDEIWNPLIQILNQQSIQQTFARRVEVFSDGRVVYRQRAWGTFSQPLQLRDFPFDEQTIRIDLVAAGYSPEDLSLTIDNGSGIAPVLSIPDWSVLDWRTQSGVIETGPENTPVSTASLVVDLKRHPGFFIVKVLLPLVLIVLMSWTVFWINPQNAGPQISISVTAILTLIAFLFSMSSMLPRLPMLTRLDWFVMYSTFLVFFSLIEAVYTIRLANSGDLEKALLADRVARWIFPLLLLAMLIHSFYWMS